jgi:hypothetical protein
MIISQTLPTKYDVYTNKSKKSTGSCLINMVYITLVVNINLFTIALII